MITKNTNQIRFFNHFNEIKEVRQDEVVAKFQHAVETPQYFPRYITKPKSNELGYKILKTCINPQQGIHPRIFCRRWFGLEEVNEYCPLCASTT